MSYMYEDFEGLGLNTASMGSTGPFSMAASAVNPLAPVVGFFADLIGSIGAGRKEADVIVPEQEKLGRYLGELDQYLKYPLSVPQLQQAYMDLAGYWQSYTNWLYSEQFTADGDTRASDQSVGAGLTDGPHMEWQVNARLATIQRMILQAGGVVPPMQAMQNQYTGYNRLDVLRPNQSYFPQAGTLPPVNSYPMPGDYAQPAPAVPQGLVYAGLAALGGLLLFGR